MKFGVSTGIEVGDVQAYLEAVAELFAKCLVSG
jgi:hypothetical protein